jgi:Na+/H+ antiporter NhaD/arsenite permease-like protein
VLQQQEQSIIAIAIFVLVYFLIVFGRKRFDIPIWTSMLIGAALMIGFQIISIQSAFKSINLDVIGFLFGMFSIVSALDKSGVLTVVSAKMLSKAKNNPNLILLVFVVGLGLLSAFLLNDTMALLGIPLVVYVSKRIGIRSSILLIALSFGITVGSTMTPIGNPQNLLIALQSGIPLPFITFLKYLGIPTIVNLFLTYLILKVYYRKELSLLPSTTTTATTSGYLQTQDNGKKHQQQYVQEENLIGGDDDKAVVKDDTSKKDVSVAAFAGGAMITNPHLAKISIVILLATIAGFIISDIIQFAFHIANLSLSIIAMLGATALYALGKERREILVSVDYSVLVFFAAMFVFTYGLWSSGIISLVISHFPTPDKHDIFQSNAIISAISIALSQVLSNVPFVAIYNTVMINNGFANGANGGDSSNNTSQWMMLAAASTIAGNLTILAAASNIIIIEAAESKGIKAFTFFEYFKIGAVVTLANIVVYYLFLLL